MTESQQELAKVMAELKASRIRLEEAVASFAKSVGVEIEEGDQDNRPWEESREEFLSARNN